MNSQIIETDVLIIGSGPVGATFARSIRDALPAKKILMIDLGPRLSEKAGMHVKNIIDEKQRENAQIQSQGPHKTPYPLITISERAQAAIIGKLSLDLLARPGTHLLSENEIDLIKNEMPAAAHSSNIGGMGAHWTCACPRPGNAERIPFIPFDEYEEAFSKAEELLHVTQQAFAPSSEGLAIQNILGSIFNKNQSPGRLVQAMPLACIPKEKDEQYWVGPDIILGELALDSQQQNFELRSETICRRLIYEDGHITGADIEHLPTKTKSVVKAKIYITACDAFRTPQLLWASGIRPKALGHYLNEHPFVFAFVELNDDLVDKKIGNMYDPSTRKESTIGVFSGPL